MSISLLSFLGLLAASPRRPTADAVAAPLPAIDHPALALPQGDRPLPAAPRPAVDRTPVSHQVRVRRTARRGSGGYARRPDARL